MEDGWSCKSDEALNLKKSRLNLSPNQTIGKTTSLKPSPNAEEFSFSSEPLGVEDDDEVTECKIRAFLDELRDKRAALILQKVQHVMSSYSL